MISGNMYSTFLWLMFLCFSFVVVTQSSLVNLFFFHAVFSPKAFCIVCEMFRKQKYALKTIPPPKIDHSKIKDQDAGQYNSRD